jgi:hypothetical protein
VNLGKKKVRVAMRSIREKYVRTIMRVGIRCGKINIKARRS